MSPFHTRTPAHVMTKKINFPVKRPSSGPSLAMVRQTPIFKLFAIPKEADNIDVKRVNRNNAWVFPIMLNIEVSSLPVNNALSKLHASIVNLCIHFYHSLLLFPEWALLEPLQGRPREFQYSDRTSVSAQEQTRASALCHESIGVLLKCSLSFLFPCTADMSLFVCKTNL